MNIGDVVKIPRGNFDEQYEVLGRYQTPDGVVNRLISTDSTAAYQQQVWYTDEEVFGTEENPTGAIVWTKVTP